MSPDIMESTQDMLLRIIKEHPGATTNEIRRISGMNYPDRSLKNLKKWRLVRCERIDHHGANRFFAVEQ